MAVSVTTSVEFGDILPREEVHNFAVDMERVLRRNDYKGGWSEMYSSSCLSRMYDEIRELNAATRDDDPRMMRKEAVDVANFAMFLVNAIDGGRVD